MHKYVQMTKGMSTANVFFECSVNKPNKTVPLGI